MPASLMLPFSKASKPLLLRGQRVVDHFARIVVLEEPIVLADARRMRNALA